MKIDFDGVEPRKLTTLLERHTGYLKPGQMVRLCASKKDIPARMLRHCWFRDPTEIDLYRTGILVEKVCGGGIMRLRAGKICIDFEFPLPDGLFEVVPQN